MSGSMFKRRDGTAGISGHLYETKLLSLVYFRAIHDETIEEFQLASNVDNIGGFDDICFKATVKNHDKPICLFIQAKHKENKNKTLKIALETYFISYLKIRQYFNPSMKDLFFGCNFDETECYFVIYTTARDKFSNDSKVKSSLCSNLHDLILTGGTAKQSYNLGEDTESLCEVAIKEHMALLAERMAKHVMGIEKFEMMLTTELMMCYHVILGQKVVDLSEIHPGGHRIATFRQDFFNTNDKYLTVFKDALYNEIVKKRKLDPTDNIKSLLPEFLADTTDAEKLSKLIGPVVTYKKGVLLINKQYAEYVKPQQVDEVNLSPETVNQAVELAAKEILLSPKLDLKVPAAFGNKDLTLKKPKRINYLEPIITDLLDKCKYTKIVTIDETLQDGFLRLKGGIAGAIGNIFVLDDDDPKLMKVTSDANSLGSFAKSLYQRLNDKIELINKNRTDDKIPDFCEYKFCFKFKKCPKLSLECSEYEDNLARDFLNKLLIYSGQADEKGVEKQLRANMKDKLDHSDYFQAEIEPIFLKYHNEIQMWWMQSNEVSYLNKSSQIFQKAISYTIEDPLMTSISVPYMRKIKQYNYRFTEEAVRSLNLQDQRSSTIIIAESCVLTVVKVFQYLKEEGHFVLDLESIVNLPKMNERKALRRELTNTEKVLILVCNNIQNSDNEKRTFENVAEAVRNKKTIIITKHAFIETIKKYFGTADSNIVHDDRNSLIDMSEDSQINVLESGKVKFKGLEVGLKHFVTGWTRGLADANLGRDS